MRSVFRGLRRCLRGRSAQKPCSHRARAVVCRPIVECLEDRSLPSVGFVETPLVSNIPGLAAHTDPDLLNPWGFIETPQGQFHIESTMDDYREVDGVKIAFLARQKTSVAEFVIKLTEVKHNVAIDDAKFNKPSGQ